MGPATVMTQQPQRALQMSWLDGMGLAGAQQEADSTHTLVI
jgi:hypothetical protein